MAITKLLFAAAAALLALPAFPQSADQPGASPRATYLLGPDDIISIKAVDAEEISDKAIRIGPNGSINLAMVGRVQASGLTAEDLEKELVAKLKQYIRNPEVSVNLVEQRSQPVSVFGAVKTPGVQQLQGRKTLVEVLSLAGGVGQDAGYSVKITRQKEWGPIPLPDAVVDASGQFSVAELNLKAVIDASNPSGNIFIMPHDVISVPRSEMVYVIGDVKKAGGFVLGDRPRVSVLQALSMAAGLEKTAAASKATIMRAGSSKDLKRTEIAVNLKRIQTGKDPDVPMEPDDVLVVPGSKSRNALIRGLEAALQIGTGLVIYRGL